MRHEKTPLRIVSSINVATARPPNLLDYDQVDENLEPTAELPRNDEWFEHVKLDARDQSVTCSLMAHSAPRGAR